AATATHWMAGDAPLVSLDSWRISESDASLPASSSELPECDLVAEDVWLAEADVVVVAVEAAVFVPDAVVCDAVVLDTVGTVTVDMVVGVRVAELDVSAVMDARVGDDMGDTDWDGGSGDCNGGGECKTSHDSEDDHHAL
ncbi:hypothetical protein IWQ56_002183, partial [Coemansia nantahalensis]